MLSDNYITVSDLNSYIKTYLENNYFLQDIYVKGEISNFKRHQSGTLYFAIKDENCAINVVMFSTYANRLKVSLKDGWSLHFVVEPNYDGDLSYEIGLKGPESDIEEMESFIHENKPCLMTDNGPVILR